ncbi:VOC family protein [Frankia tisae]|uniref:VOC family protein n=1 Tax=Frankia tisae TaxID=2950104 RepID=UPI0021C2067F|nr:VOC family protein [Frankia tisae]
MHIDRIDHLVLTVAGIDRTTDWYTRVPGMTPVTFRGGRRALAFGQQEQRKGRLAARAPPGRLPAATSATRMTT